MSPLLPLPFSPKASRPLWEYMYKEGALFSSPLFWLTDKRIVCVCVCESQMPSFSPTLPLSFFLRILRIGPHHPRSKHFRKHSESTLDKDKHLYTHFVNKYTVRRSRAVHWCEVHKNRHPRATATRDFVGSEAENVFVFVTCLINCDVVISSLNILIIKLITCVHNKMQKPAHDVLSQEIARTQRHGEAATQIISTHSSQVQNAHQTFSHTLGGGQAKQAKFQLHPTFCLQILASRPRHISSHFLPGCDKTATAHGSPNFDQA